jgi:hypothetical protein
VQISSDRVGTGCGDRRFGQARLAAAGSRFQVLEVLCAVFCRFEEISHGGLVVLVDLRCIPLLGGGVRRRLFGIDVALVVDRVNVRTPASARSRAIGGARTLYYAVG